jgi:hypothetical protein
VIITDKSDMARPRKSLKKSGICPFGNFVTEDRILVSI